MTFLTPRDALPRSANQMTTDRRNDGARTMSGKRRTLQPGQVPPGWRPTPRNALERAERIADDLEGMLEDYDWVGSLLARFRNANQRAVIDMWKSGTNEAGKPLSSFERKALTERWVQLFGFLPPLDDTASAPSTPAAPPPADDTMLSIKDVVRMTGLSESTIERRIADGKFPKATKLSARRIGWPAGKVKAWIAERDAGLRNGTLVRCEAAR
jgi:prophage regulatory protein